MGSKYEIRTKDGKSHYLSTFRDFIKFYKLKNGSEITTIKATDNVRSARSKYVWMWNDETQEMEQHIIEPDSAVDKYLKLRDYYTHRPDKFIAVVFGIKLKWYQKLWLIMNSKIK